MNSLEIIEDEKIPEQYYYNVTGDIVAGDNKNSPEFSYENSRFYLDQPQEIITQGSSWDDPVDEESSPYCDFCDVLAPYQ